MLGEEARVLLSFLPNSTPSSSQISEAYTCLQPGVRREVSASGTYSLVVRTGVPRAHGGSRNHALIGIPFICVVLGTVTLDGSSATRPYRRQKEASPLHNLFFPEVYVGTIFVKPGTDFSDKQGPYYVEEK
ncbi:hypothetical protein L1887_29133 [Cichorium endivia]|nr:hypothetical protein L1887_29133 [Cichorium endivia]